MALKFKNKSKALGISITDGSIRSMVFGAEKNFLIPKYWAEEKIQNSLVVEGVIKDTDAVSLILKNIRKKMKMSSAHVAVPDSAVYTTLLELPSVPAKEARGIIEVHLRNHLPYKREEFSFKYKIQSVGHGRTTFHVSVFAKEIITKYTKVFHDAGFKVLSLEPENESLARAYFKRGSFPTLIVWIGEHMSTLSVIYDGLVVFSSSFPFSTTYIEKSLMHDLGIDNDRALKIIQTGFLKNNESNKEQSAVIRIFAPFIDEVDRAIVHFSAQVKEMGLKTNGVESIILGGAGSTVSGVAEYFSARLSVFSSVGNVWTNAHLDPSFVPEIPFDDSVRFAVSIGLALKDLEIK